MVLGNWNSVLRAVHMASQKIPKPREGGEGGEGSDGAAGAEEAGARKLPQTLVRIPIQQAEQAKREAEAAVAEEGGG